MTKHDSGIFDRMVGIYFCIALDADGQVKKAMTGTEAGQDVDLGQFEDADEISEDAADAVRWAYAVDLLTEKNGSLHITDELSQKELTRMLEDFLDLLS